MVILFSICRYSVCIEVSFYVNIQSIIIDVGSLCIPEVIQVLILSSQYMEINRVRCELL
jgi:hypothetical protein